MATTSSGIATATNCNSLAKNSFKAGYMVNSLYQCPKYSEIDSCEMLTVTAESSTTHYVETSPQQSNGVSHGYYGNCTMIGSYTPYIGYVSANPKILRVCYPYTKNSGNATSFAFSEYAVTTGVPHVAYNGALARIPISVKAGMSYCGYVNISATCGWMTTVSGGTSSSGATLGNFYITNSAMLYYNLIIVNSDGTAIITNNEGSQTDVSTPYYDFTADYTGTAYLCIGVKRGSASIVAYSNGNHFYYYPCVSFSMQTYTTEYKDYNSNQCVQYAHISRAASKSFYVKVTNAKNSNAKLDYCEVYYTTSSTDTKGTVVTGGSANPGSVSSEWTKTFYLKFPAAAFTGSTTYYVGVRCGNTNSNQKWKYRLRYGDTWQNWTSASTTDRKNIYGIPLNTWVAGSSANTYKIPFCKLDGLTKYCTGIEFHIS